MGDQAYERPTNPIGFREVASDLRPALQDVAVITKSRLHRDRLDLPVKRCPNCHLTNPDNAMRCDCGFDFNSQTVKESYLPAKERHVVRNTSISALVGVGIVRALILLDRGEWAGACGVVAVYLILTAVVLLWRKYLAIRWRRLTWR